MDAILIAPIFLPLAAGALTLIFPRRSRGMREGIVILTSAVMIAISVIIFLQPDLIYHAPWLTLRPGLEIPFNLQSTPFARFALVIISCFSLIAAIYSIRYMEDHHRVRTYYAYYLAALGVTCGALLAENFVVLLFFWELHGFFLFLMAGINGEEAVPSSAKTLILAGVGDLTLMMGICLLWLGTGSLSMREIAMRPLLLDNGLTVTAFVLMIAGGFAKGGVMPLHSWIPAISTSTPLTVMSYFTSLDKVLGFYLITSLTLRFFVLNDALSLVLILIGSITLLGAVLMAMIQHDYRKMLAFHSVSQVGYMLIGIGTGTAIGIVGGLFHLLNMIILKGSLYLCGGSVQRQTGKTKFEEMGGLAKSMPWTFAGTLVAALGIAGVPPLNAFVSKWLIYQGLLEWGGAGYPIFVAVAMFGSALTLASFVKLLYSMFWGERPSDLAEVRESPTAITIPLIVLALAAIGFGVFYQSAVTIFFQPIVGVSDLQIPGIWDAGLAFILLCASLLIGLLIAFLGRPRDVIYGETFTGGESLDPQSYRVPGTDFYGPVKEFPGLKQTLRLADRGLFDVYNGGFIVIRRFSKIVYQYIDRALAEFYEDIIPALLTVIGRLLRILNARLVLTHLLWILYFVSALALFFLPANESVSSTVRVIACVGMLGWAFLAWVEIDLMRMFLLSATSQVGLILLGGSLSPAIAISYLITSGSALILLALDSWFIKRKFGTTKIESLNGVSNRLPIPFFIFLIAALWLSGLPPFGNFFSKYLLGVAAEEISPLLGMAITGTAILTLAYLLRPIRQFMRSA